MKHCIKDIFKHFYAASLFIVFMSLNTIVTAQTADGLETETDTNIINEMNWEASVGLGYNTNIYQAPSESYIDYGPTTPVNVDPVTHAGAFVPLELRAEYMKSFSEQNSLLTSYRFNGNIYIDSDYRNADETTHTFKFGDKYYLAEKGRLKDAIYGGLILIKKEDEYTERDTGLDKVSSGGVNISDRYAYTGKGVELKYNKRTSKIKYGIEFQYIDRDFKDAVAISQLDHKYTSLGGDVKFSVNKASKIKLGYEHYIYDYKERPSRDANGRAFASNPPLKYVYDKFSVSYIYKVNRNTRTFIDYSYTSRSDEYLGYNNYTRNKVKIRALYDYSKKVDLKAAFTYWERKYPNAFAFDRFVPGLNEEAKNYDGTKLELVANYSQNDNRYYWLNFSWYDENSTDLRYQYERMEIMTGIKWEY